MRDEDLRAAMSDIDDAYILEASPDDIPSGIIPIWKRRRFRKASGIVAACLAVGIGIGAFSVIRMEMKEEPVMQSQEAYDREPVQAADSARQKYEAEAEYEAAAEHEAESETASETETKNEK